MFDEQGLPLTSASVAAVEAYNQALCAFLEYRLTAMPLMKRAVAEDPGFCMAHCMRGCFLMVIGSFSVLDNVRQTLVQAERLAPAASERERQHVRALRYWVEGDLVGACTTWERILFMHPLDLLALRLHHFNSFWMGRTRALRAVPAAVLPSWNAGVQGYGNVLGMLAFGFEENGEYVLAERYGREAVQRNAHDLWALHAVGHVLEMQGRRQEGVQWLTRPVDHWDDRNPFRRHLWWHLALFLIEDGQCQAALDLYDRSINDAESDFYLDIQNAASLLARLEFCGVDVGTRWRSLANHAESHVDDHALIFTDLHCVMSLAHERRFEQARRLIASMQAHARDETKFATRVIRDIGVPLCEGIIDFERGRYDEAIARLLPLRHVTGPIGASHAQRDIVDQYLLEAALRGQRRDIALGLLQERRLIKPDSAETAIKQRRLDALDNPSGISTIR